MPVLRRPSAVIVSALVSALVSAPLAAPSSAAPPGRVAQAAEVAPADPCADVVDERCTEGTPADIDGDGRADRIGVVRRGENGAPLGAIIIRLETAAGVYDDIRRFTVSWYGPSVRGTAELDSRPGEELVIGRTRNTFQVITWRGGRMVSLGAPGGREWTINTGGDLQGWWRRASEPPGLLRLRQAEQIAQGGDRWLGTTTTYRHRVNRGWRLVDRATRVVDADRAFSWVGWRVPGLGPTKG